jgi:hypothetical protein
MLVPLTQLLRVIKVYFPLALPGAKGIIGHRAWSMEHRVKRDEKSGETGETGKEDRNQRSEIRGQIEDCRL